MKKLKKIANTAICSVLSATIVAGCGTAVNINDGAPIRNPAGMQDEPATETQTSATEITSEFNKKLIEYVEATGLKNENYMISPMSFKAAMILAVAGAEGETREQLIHSMGFADMDQYNAWYNTTTEMIKSFDEEIALGLEEFEDMKRWLPDAEAPEGSLIMLNSIWNNIDLNGKFGKEYLKNVKKAYNAEANNVSAKEITKKVNNWVSKGTNGLIPEISSDLSTTNAVLVNTLYLKSGWVNSFNEYQTAPGQFTTATGDKVEKEFMEQQEEFWYYEDKESKLVSLPINGGLEMILVLGENEDFVASRSKATRETVHVKMPKFDVESSFTQDEFISFLQEHGANLAFTPEADFSEMCPDASWYISDIIQKTRIKVDEQGLEAAAATAVMMTEGAIFNPPEPKEFVANKPFKFYIVGGEYHDKVLFCGQIAQ